jgi:hypothetical protein
MLARGGAGRPGGPGDPGFWVTLFGNALRQLGLQGTLCPIASNLARLALFALLLALIGVVSLAPWLLVKRARLGRWLGRFGPILIAPSLFVPWIHGDCSASLPLVLVAGLAVAPVLITLTMAAVLSVDPMAARGLRVTSWVLVMLGLAVTGLHAGRVPQAAGSPHAAVGTDIATLVVLIVWMLALCRLAKHRMATIILRRLSEQKARLESSP